MSIYMDMVTIFLDENNYNDIISYLLTIQKIILQRQYSTKS